MTDDNSADNPDKHAEETAAAPEEAAAPVYECHICGYKPRPTATNPKEALRKHMARYHKHSNTEQAVDAIVQDIVEASSKEEECSKLH